MLPSLYLCWKWEIMNINFVWTNEKKIYIQNVYSLSPVAQGHVCIPSREAAPSACCSSEFFVSFFFTNYCLSQVSRLNSVLCGRGFLISSWCFLALSSFCLFFRNGMYNFYITVVAENYIYGLRSVVLYATGERPQLEDSSNSYSSCII